MIELLILGKLVSIEKDLEDTKPVYWFPTIMTMAQVFIWPFTLFVVMWKLWKWNLVISLVVPIALALLSMLGNPMNYVYYGVFALIIYMFWIIIDESLTEGRQIAMIEEQRRKDKND